MAIKRFEQFSLIITAVPADLRGWLCPAVSRLFEFVATPLMRAVGERSPMKLISKLTAGQGHRLKSQGKALWITNLFKSAAVIARHS